MMVLLIDEDEQADVFGLSKLHVLIT